MIHKYVPVAVRPESTEIIGLNGPVEDGTVVGLTCRTRGARPAAWITWYNGSTPLAETPTDDVALRVSLWWLAGKCLSKISVFLDRNSETASGSDSEEGNRDGCGRSGLKRDISL